MDSEMYTDFDRSRKPAVKQNLRPAEEEDEQQKATKKQNELLEKILSKVNDLDNSIFKKVEGLLLAEKEKTPPEEDEPSRDNTVTDDKVAELEELLSDVQALKKEMEDAKWKHSPAEETDQLISDVKELKAGFDKKREAMATAKESLQQLESQTKSDLQILKKDMDDLKQDVKLIDQNLGNLFTFVYGKDHGRSMKLKGGWQDEKFVIQAVKLKPTV